jgi:hypothetical protein
VKHRAIAILFISLIFGPIIFGPNCKATGESKEMISFRIQGGGMITYTDDQLYVDKSRIRFKTVSPSFSEVPNYIGSFEADISKSEFESLKKTLLTYFAQIEAVREIKPDTIVETLVIDGKQKIWNAGQDNQNIKKIRSLLLSKAEAALKKPIQAIGMLCAKEKNEVECKIKNVGKKTALIVDPLGVNHSIYCIDIRGHRKPLHKTSEYDPKKMTPDEVSLEPGESLSFSVEASDCYYRIVLTTSAMMANEAYDEAVLGEIISNQIVK